MRKLILAASALSMLALAGCGANPQASTDATVAGIQKWYPVVKAAANLYVNSGNASASSVLTIAKVEKTLDVEVPALTGTVAPTTVKNAIGDLSTLALALPDSVLSETDKSAIALLVAGADAMLSYSPTTTVSRG